MPARKTYKKDGRLNNNKNYFNGLIANRFRFWLKRHRANISNWILSTGFWDDSAIWVDTEVWND